MSTKTKQMMVFLKGMLMGTCDIIPGVSGGTIAFITGIYDRLIDALHSFNLNTLKLLFQGKHKEVWTKIDGTFLVLLFGGILLAILLLSTLLSIGLEKYPMHIWSFFFGLILASAYLMKTYIKNWTAPIVLLLIFGVLIGYFLSNLNPLNIGTANITMLISGAIAIIAMILPGVSGSYILLILGQYGAVLGYVTSITKGEINSLIPLGFFIVGAAIGLVLFSKVLYRIKSRYHNQMVAVLIGIMLGSLNKLRPRKETIEIYIDRNGQKHSLVTKNLLPIINTDFFKLLSLAIAGIFIVLGVHFLANKLNKKTPSTR